MHDVVEDNDDWTLDRLRREGFSENVVAGVESVTERDGEDYMAFVQRASLNPIGRRVKRADLVMSNEPQIQELVALYAMISRMRVMSLPRTVACADEIMRATIDTYFAPNKTIRELNELMKSGAGIDPLKSFSEAARDELRAFTPL